jgi:hypothetical protein
VASAPLPTSTPTTAFVSIILSPFINHDQAGSVIVTSSCSSLECQMDVNPPLIETLSTETIAKQLQNQHGWMLLDELIVDSNMNLTKLSDQFLELTGKSFAMELWKVHIAKVTLDPSEEEDSAIVAKCRQ